MVAFDNGRAIHALVFLVLSAIDISFNAAAGPAAVATGAHVQGSPLTQHALKLGALAAVTKAGILAFTGFLQYATFNLGILILLAVPATSFGICALVTAEISNIVYDNVPTPLLIAAVVAAIPLAGECAGAFTSGPIYSEVEDVEPSPCGYIQKWIFIIGLDALGGFTFAAMAQHEGMQICDRGAAAAAGGVYGVLSAIPKIVASITWLFVRIEVD